MGRRRNRDNDWIELVIKLGGLVFLLSLISPQVGQMIATIGVVAVCLLIVGLGGFIVYRLATRSRRSNAAASYDIPVYTDTTSPGATLPQIEGQSYAGSAAIQTTAALIERLRAIDWFQFEQVVALAYQKLGYRVTRRGGANPDGGIDLIIEKDGQRAAVQCKQWKAWNVGVKAVREFLGALTDAGIQKGIFITLCGYTGDAKQLADKHGIEIVNEAGLAQMLEATDAKYDPETLGILNDERKYCPKCESIMVLRTATKGLNAGGQFWGCSTYPRCRFTLPVT